MSNLDGGVVLSFMRKALRDFSGLQSHRFYELMGKTLENLSAAGLIAKLQGPTYDTLSRIFNKAPGIPHQHLSIWLAEAYQQLLAHGYIVPAPDFQKFDAYDFVVTSTGEQWAAGFDLVPEDMKGYLGTLKELVPTIDGVVLEYVREALATYQHCMFFSSAVMIGAASEKLIYLLMDVLLKTVGDPKRKKDIQRAIERRSLPLMFKCLHENVAQAKDRGMPYPVHEEAEHHLLALQDAIRMQRNDAVHPQLRQVSPESVQLTLIGFPYACKKAYDLIGWFDQNTI